MHAEPSRGAGLWSEVDVLTRKRVAVLLSSVAVNDGRAVVPVLKHAVTRR
jgi:hypothetical protein